MDINSRLRAATSHQLHTSIKMQPPHCYKLSLHCPFQCSLLRQPFTEKRRSLVSAFPCFPHLSSEMAREYLAGGTGWSLVRLIAEVDIAAVVGTPGAGIVNCVVAAAAEIVAAPVQRHNH